MSPKKSGFSFLRSKAAAMFLALLTLSACNDKCCFVGPVGDYKDCNISGGGGECGFSQCVSIGVDATSTACATGDGGADPYFIQDIAKRGATATYTITTRTFGVADQTNTFNITLSAGEKLFVTCGQVFAGPTTPAQQNFPQLVSFQMLSSTAQASLRPIGRRLAKGESANQPTPVEAPKNLDIQACDRLCKNASGKCVFLDADALITKDQEVGLSKLFVSVTKKNSSEISQSTLLGFFGMQTDPCSRSATEFQGDKNGKFKNTGHQCTLAFENPQAQGSGHSWLSIPAELTGTFERDAGSVTLSFDGGPNRASLQTDGKDGFSRKDFTQIYGTPGRILAAAGDRCVAFQYPASTK